MNEHVAIFGILIICFGANALSISIWLQGFSTSLEILTGAASEFLYVQQLLCEAFLALSSEQQQQQTPCSCIVSAICFRPKVTSI